MARPRCFTTTLPMDFREHYPNCTVIIDCFEIDIERPTNLLARAQTFSSYEHHNTAKYLIGITPQGTVSYISCGWGGRVSDKHLTENCGLMKFLLPGDTILADRGFDIQESVGLYCARVHIPSFTKGKKQLTGIEVEQTQHIANVRIHVERVIVLSASGIKPQFFSWCRLQFEALEVKPLVRTCGIVTGHHWFFFRPLTITVSILIDPYQVLHD